LISGGGLGEALPPETFGFGEAAWRTVFDLSYFILITIIALNVVFGAFVLPILPECSSTGGVCYNY